MAGVLCRKARTVNAVDQAKAEVEEVYHEGIENCRRGRRGSDRLWSNNPGSVGARFAQAYSAWMNLRARYGDPFSLSLGYKGS